MHKILINLDNKKEKLLQTKWIRSIITKRYENNDIVLLYTAVKII